MTSRFVRLAVLLPALFFAACANVPPREALPMGAMDKFSSTEIIVPVKQQEIYVFVPMATGGAGFGLVGALVDVSVDFIRTSKAEAAVKTLRDSLVDFQYDKVLQDDFKASLSQLSWTNVGTVRVVKEVTNDSFDKALVDSNADAVLFANCDYHLDNDGAVLTVGVTVNVFPKSEALRSLKPSKVDKPKTAIGNTIYHNLGLIFETKAPGITDDRDHNMAIWSANNGALMRAALSMGATKLAAMMADDIGRPAIVADAGAKPAKAVTVDSFTGEVVNGDDDGQLIRNKDGRLLYATKSVLAP